MLESVASRLDSVEQKLGSFEEQQSGFKEQLRVMDQCMKEMNKSIEELQASQVEFVRKEKVVEIEQMLDDLSNRSHRNNLVVWGMSENSEGESTDCKVLMQVFLLHIWSWKDQ